MNTVWICGKKILKYFEDYYNDENEEAEFEY
jgi:hypothetical protein